jgi:hypothetical protein
MGVELCGGLRGGVFSVDSEVAAATGRWRLFCPFVPRHKLELHGDAVRGDRCAPHISNVWCGMRLRCLWLRSAHVSRTCGAGLRMAAHARHFVCPPMTISVAFVHNGAIYCGTDTWTSEGKPLEERTKKLFDIPGRGRGRIVVVIAGYELQILVDILSPLVRSGWGGSVMQCAQHIRVELVRNGHVDHNNFALVCGFDDGKPHYYRVWHGANAPDEQQNFIGVNDGGEVIQFINTRLHLFPNVQLTDDGWEALFTDAITAALAANPNPEFALPVISRVIRNEEPLVAVTAPLVLE